MTQRKIMFKECRIKNEILCQAQNDIAVEFGTANSVPFKEE